ncbi:MAG: hypothetical protein KC503_37235 [Myxococcales bacterium]|nr:hypothetical protein [Myxococcales bacterium]
MPRTPAAAALLLSVLLVGAPSAALAKKPKLAVMTIADGTRSLGTTLMDGLTDALRGKLASSGRYIVIDKSRQAAALLKLVKEQKKASYKKCYSSKCQIPLGQALAADTILRTKITRVGSTYLLNAELVDLAKEAVTGAAQASLRVRPRRGRDDRLLRAVGDIAYKLTDGSSGSAPPTMPPANSTGATPTPGTNPEPTGVEDDPDAGAAAAAAQAEADRQAAARQRTASYQAERRRVLTQQRYRTADYNKRRRSRTTMLIYGWGAIGAGALGVGLGIYYLTAKASAADDLANQATSSSGIDSALDEAKSARRTGLIFVGLGGAAAAVGAVLLMLAPSLDEPKQVGALQLQKMPTAAPTLGGGLVSWGGRF